MTVTKREGVGIDERVEGRCGECGAKVTQAPFSPEVGHAEGCLWTIHDDDDDGQAEGDEPEEDP